MSVDDSREGLGEIKRAVASTADAELSFDAPEGEDLKVGDVLRQGRDILEARGNIIVGASVGNTYYNDETIYDTLLWALSQSTADIVYLFTAEQAYQHTFDSMYFLKGGRRRKRPHDPRNNRRHSVSRAISRLFASHPHHQGRIVIIHDRLEGSPQATRMNIDGCSELFLSPEHASMYQDSIATVQSAFDSNLQFQNDILAMSTKVLSKPHFLSYHQNFPDRVPTAVRMASRYVVEEIAFFAVVSQMVAAERGTVLLYHDLMALWAVAKYFGGKYGNPVQSDPRFGIVIRNIVQNTSELPHESFEAEQD